jgi:hypothetical protein
MPQQHGAAMLPIALPANVQTGLRQTRRPGARSAIPARHNPVFCPCTMKMPFELTAGEQPANP